MNILLVFFAIPLATIILSIIFETFIRCSLKVTGIAFSIFLIIAFVLGGTTEYIVATIIYTAISFIASYLSELFSRNRYYGNSINFGATPNSTEDFGITTEYEQSNNLCPSNNSYNSENFSRNKYYR